MTRFKLAQAHNLAANIVLQDLTPILLAVIKAEQLAALLNIQTVRPGSPIIYATDSPPASARTGNPNFLAPEYPLIAAGCSQMAKFYRQPSMGGHGPVDGMVATMGDFETDLLIIALTMMSRTDLTAWLGMCANGLSASLLQLVYDAEVFEHARAYLRHFIIDEENLALSGSYWKVHAKKPHVNSL